MTDNKPNIEKTRARDSHSSLKGNIEKTNMKKYRTNNEIVKKSLLVILKIWFRFNLTKKRRKQSIHQEQSHIVSFNKICRAFWC